MRYALPNKNNSIVTILRSEFHRRTLLKVRVYTKLLLGNSQIASMGIQ